MSPAQEIVGLEYYLDTFKDIWGPEHYSAFGFTQIKFRYLQGYMGTPENRSHYIQL